MKTTRTLLIALAAWLVAGCAEETPAPPTASPDSLRTLAQGEVVGFVGRHGDHRFLGLPFAAPPTGELRWRAPRPAETWSGTREALTAGASCPQFASPAGGRGGEEAGQPTGSEDCLFANVFAPRFSPAEVPTGADRLPVMVWIHGGGNTIGDAVPYDGGPLATRHDVIVVAVQYRLGVFGWFDHPALVSEVDDPLDRSGNYGTLDLVQALTWVRENAPAFGGDPDNVTIFGESAGGRNVMSLLVSPAARGLFHRAISQSGGLRTASRAEARNLTDASDPGQPGSSSEVLLSLLIADGAVDRSAAKIRAEAMDDTEIAAYLRGKSADEILSVFDGSGLGGMYRCPQLIRDGAVVPTSEPEELFAHPDGAARVPTMLGTNRDETKLFMAFGSPHVRRAFGIPLWLKDERIYDLEAEYQSNLWKARGVDEPAAAMRAARATPVFAYRFDWDEEPEVFFADLSKIFGAAHAVEIPFVFGTLDLGRANRFLWDEDRIPARDALSDAVMSYWAEFAYSGDPGRGRSGTLETWKPWDASRPDAPKFLVLDTREDGGIRMSSETVSTASVLAKLEIDDRFESHRERCDLFRQLVERDDAFSEDDYRSVAGGACRDFPIGESPRD